MVIKAQFEIPKSWTKAKKAAAEADEIYPGKPDIDNIAKIVLDSFNGVVFEDDAQVYDLKVFKRYAESRVNHDCDLVKRPCNFLQGR